MSALARANSLHGGRDTFTEEELLARATPPSATSYTSDLSPLWTLVFWTLVFWALVFWAPVTTTLWALVFTPDLSPLWAPEPPLGSSVLPPAFDSGLLFLWQNMVAW